MKKKIIKLVESRIDTLYQEARSLLLNKKSYDTECIDIQSAMLYIAFLESSLKKPYNRLNSLTAFISDDGALLIDQMLPFAMLYDDTKEVIKGKAQRAGKLAAGLDVSEIDVNYLSLCTEEYMKI